MDDHLVLPAVAKAMLASAGDPFMARALAMKHGAPGRALRILERAVGAGGLSDGSFGEALSDWRIASTAFFGAMRTRSVFFRLWDQGLRRVPARTHLGVVSLNASAWTTGEGAARPISRLTLNVPPLLPQTATAIVAVTNEVARNSDPAALTLVNNALRDAVADAVDEAFFASIVDSSTAIEPSVGNDRASMLQDLRALLGEVNVNGAGSLFWIMAADVATAAALLDEAGSMSPLGGELLNLPALVGTTIPAGTIYLVNGAEIAAALEGIEFDVSGQAALEMLDEATGSSTVPTAAALVSLWQSGATAMKADVRFSVKRLRSSAIAARTDVAWLLPVS
ncbi:MAG: phage major capsid protein [Mesorhizobium sp.]|nr:phage major capsid protein [Mesorhizobium sp.]